MAGVRPAQHAVQQSDSGWRNEHRSHRFGHRLPTRDTQIPPHGAVPVAQPVYVPPPIPGTIPVYPAGYPVPYGVYPGYPYPYPMQPTAVVLPPGYTRDYSAGFSPFGDLADDINNLF